jgi:hypothetical protein
MPPYPVQAIADLGEDFSAEHFRFAITQIRNNVAHVSGEDNSSDQQVARIKILKYLDLQLACAARWIDDSADLMALVLRRLIELRFYSDYVGEGQPEASRFLAEADTDSKEVYELMRRAFPDDMLIHDVPESEKRLTTKRQNAEEEVLFKLCSKFIHPSALTMYDLQATVLSEDYRQMFALRVVFYGWGILQMFHTITWTD